MRLLTIVAVYLCFSSLLVAQESDSYKESRILLKGLSNTEYITKALSISQNYLVADQLDNAEKMLDLAIKKGNQTGGKGTTLAIQEEFINEALNCCTQNTRVLLLLINSLESLYDADKNNIKAKYVTDIVKRINQSTEDQEILAALYGFINDKLNNPDLVIFLKKNSLSKIKTNLLQTQIKSRESNIKKLNIENLRQEALLSYNARILDSMKYENIIDSISDLQRERELRGQRATIQLQEADIAIKNKEKQFWQIAFASGLVGVGLIGFLFFQKKKYSDQLNKKNLQLEQEKERSEHLLLNILPKNIAEELKKHGTVKSKFFQEGTVLFSDFANFSGISKLLSTDQLVEDLDLCFATFDRLANQYGVEKIKTIGDAYMCIGGVPKPSKNATADVIKLGFAMQEYLYQWNEKRRALNLPEFVARIGIHTGPIVAGVVGKNKFAYDVWGDTVNIAARMENKGVPYKVNVSAAVYQKCNNLFEFEPRGSIAVKNMTEMKMYFASPLSGKKSESKED